MNYLFVTQQSQSISIYHKIFVLSCPKRFRSTETSPKLYWCWVLQCRSCANIAFAYFFFIKCCGQNPTSNRSQIISTGSEDTHKVQWRFYTFANAYFLVQFHKRLEVWLLSTSISGILYLLIDLFFFSPKYLSIFDV